MSKSKEQKENKVELVAGNTELVKVQILNEISISLRAIARNLEKNNG